MGVNQRPLLDTGGVGSGLDIFSQSMSQMQNILENQIRQILPASVQTYEVTPGVFDPNDPYRDFNTQGYVGDIATNASWAALQGNPNHMQPPGLQHNPIPLLTDDRPSRYGINSNDTPTMPPPSPTDISSQNSPWIHNADMTQWIQNTSYVPPSPGPQAQSGMSPVSPVSPWIHNADQTQWIPNPAMQQKQPSQGQQWIHNADQTKWIQNPQWSAG